MKKPIIVTLIMSIFVASQAAAGIQAGSKKLGAVWFIGDSITQSNCDGAGDNSPRKALHDLLKAKGYSFTFTGHHTVNPDGLPITGNAPAENLFQFHSGISGSVIGSNNGTRTGMTQNLTTFWGSGRLAQVKPNIIIIMLGANDVNSNIDTAAAPARLENLIAEIGKLPDIGNPTIILSNITPNRVPASKAQDRVTTYNEQVSALADQLRASGKDVHFTDVYTPVNTEYEKTMNIHTPEKPRFDHLHPGRYGNEVMAMQWFAKIQELAERKN